MAQPIRQAAVPALLTPASGLGALPAAPSRPGLSAPRAAASCALYVVSTVSTAQRNGSRCVLNAPQPTAAATLAGALAAAAAHTGALPTPAVLRDPVPLECWAPEAGVDYGTSLKPPALPQPPAPAQAQEEPAAADILDKRRRHLGPNLALFFPEDPLHIVRGQGCELFDPEVRRPTCWPAPQLRQVTLSSPHTPPTPLLRPAPPTPTHPPPTPATGPQLPRLHQQREPRGAVFVAAAALVPLAAACLHAVAARPRSCCVSRRCPLPRLLQVSHVGHGHPRVAAAVAQQLSLLNTNSRYLSGSLADYCEALAHRSPDPLEVCRVPAARCSCGLVLAPACCGHAALRPCVPPLPPHTTNVVVTHPCHPTSRWSTCSPRAARPTTSRGAWRALPHGPPCPTTPAHCTSRW